MSKKWKKVKRLLASVMALLLTFSVMTSAQVHAETPEETKRLSVSGEGSGSIYITDSSGRSSVNETFTKEYLAGDEISLEIQAEEGNSIGSISVNGNALEGVPEGLDTCTYQYVISDETEINVVFKDNPAAQTETQTAEATTAEEEDTGLTPRENEDTEIAKEEPDTALDKTVPESLSMENLIKLVNPQNTAVVQPSDEENEECNNVFDTLYGRAGENGISTFSVHEDHYNQLGNIGAGGYTSRTDLSLPGQGGYLGFDKYSIAIYGYDSTGMEIQLKTYTTGTLGTSKGDEILPVFCVESGKHYTQGKAQTVHNALEYYSQEEIDKIALAHKWIEEHPTAFESRWNDKTHIHAAKQLLTWIINESYHPMWSAYSNVSFTFYPSEMDWENQNKLIEQALAYANEQYSLKKDKNVPIGYGKVLVGASTDQKVAIFTTKDYETVEPVKKGGLSIQKVSGNPAVTNGNSNFSLKGAIYGVYKDAACTQDACPGIMTDANGYAATADDALDAGTYYVMEYYASPGFALDKNVYTFTVTAGVKASANKKTSTEPVESAAITINKTSADKACTDNNPNYSLAGAEYSIYKDKACTSYLNKITTDADGKGSLNNLAPGVYYVKETKASPGYAVDTTVYTADVSGGSTAGFSYTVNSKEVPLMDPVGVAIQKVDSVTNGDAQGSGTLEGAQFEVKYYADIMDTDPALSGKTPVRTWVLETKESGKARLNKECLISGDDFFYDALGSVALPYGTLTFKEIKAPEGYLINPAVIVSKIDNSGVNGGPLYQEPTQKENVLEMKLTKQQTLEDGSKLAVKGAVFEHTKPDGTKETLTTDEEGKLSFKGLQHGKHSVKEISAPAGYSVNKNVIEFTVAEDNKITVTSKAAETDTDGAVTIVNNVDLTNGTGSLDVTVENKPAPFKLHIHKVNDKNFALSGAEFTLYADAECKDAVETLSSDLFGDLTFNNLIAGKTYYLCETKAPGGYKLPLDENSKPVVYKIKAVSTPVQGKFIFYVNDKEYTSDTGDFAVSGTPEDRVCNMKIVNDAGLKLPKTGSGLMIPILIAGVILMGAALVISRKKK